MTNLFNTAFYEQPVDWCHQLVITPNDRRTVATRLQGLISGKNKCREQRHESKYEYNEGVECQKVRQDCKMAMSGLQQKCS